MRFAWFTSASGSRTAVARRLSARAGLALVGVAIAPVPTAAAAAGTADPAGALAWESVQEVSVPAGVRVLSVPSGGDPAGTIEVLERAGLHVDVALPPRLYFVRGTGGALAELAGAVDVTRSIPPAPELAAPPDAASLEWPDHVVVPSRPRGEPGARGPGPAATLSGLPLGARWGDTSEFLFGRVAVPILFPESDGSIDPNEFSWTPALRDSVLRSAVRACLQWASFGASAGVPVTFVLEPHFDLPTRYEPIRRPAGQAGLWMAEAMQTLVGYKGDADEMAYEVANEARARLGTQWASVCFAVQNDTAAVSGFPDGTSERARLGGPWFIVAVRHANAEGSTLDYYIEHEMAHMFWALDEYPATNAWWSCTLTTGYFDRQNFNSDIPSPIYCSPPHAQCMMRGNWPESLCDATAQQIGWADVDLNALLDLVETRPDVRPDSAHYHFGAGAPITVRGTASDIAWPNKNPYRFGAGDSISIATIDSITYRVAGGPWIPIEPQDGTFDSGEERFVLDLPPLPAGNNYLLELQARNSNGKSLPIPATAILSVSGASPPTDRTGERDPTPPALAAWPTPSAASVRFALRGPGGAPAEARLYDVAGRVVRSWRMEVAAGGSAGWEWDGRLAGGAPAPGGVYFLAVQVGGERLERRIVLLR